MSETVHDEWLAARFVGATCVVDDLDWADVEARADAIAVRTDIVGQRPKQRWRPRKVVLVGAGLLMGALVAASALGLPPKVVKLLFSDAEPAPPRTELAFSTLDQGAPPGLETGVIPGTARKGFEVALPQGARATLWVAPTAKGGHCQMLQLVDADGRSRGASGPGCDSRTNRTGVGLTVPGPITPRGIERGPVVLDGHATLENASSAIIRFEDGTEAVTPLIWISEPIDAGFFVYGVPPANWKPGHLPTQLRYVDIQGKAVGQPHRLMLGRFLENARR